MLRPGVPKELFSAQLFDPSHGAGGPYIPWAVSNDGQRFLVSVPPSQATETPAASPIVVVLNWLEDLKQRAGALNQDWRD